MAKQSKAKAKAIDFSLAEEFSKHWSVNALCKGPRDEEGLSYAEVLEYLAQPEVIEFLDLQSERLAKIYSRMPKYIAAQQIMNRMRTASSATEASAVVQGFIKVHDSMPEPSSNEFIDSLWKEMTNATE